MTLKARVEPARNGGSWQLVAVMLVLLLVMLPALVIGAMTVSSPPWAPGVFALTAVAYIPVVIVTLF